MSRLIPFLAIVFAIALFFLYIKPTYSGTIADTRQQIASYDQALAAADRFQKKEAELTQARAQIPAESLARLSEFLPDGVNNVQLILDMDALAARSGVTLSDFSTQGSDSSTDDQSQASTPSTTASPDAGMDAGAVPGPDMAMGGTGALTSSSPIDSLTLTFKATGTYDAFRSFLSGMENSLRPLDVIDLDVTKSDTGVYAYTMSVRIYWLR